MPRDPQHYLPAQSAPWGEWATQKRLDLERTLGRDLVNDNATLSGTEGTVNGLVRTVNSVPIVTTYHAEKRGIPISSSWSSQASVTVPAVEGKRCTVFCSTNMNIVANANPSVFCAIRSRIATPVGSSRPVPLSWAMSPGWTQEDNTSHFATSKTLPRGAGGVIASQTIWVGDWIVPSGASNFVSLDVFAIYHE